MNPLDKPPLSSIVEESTRRGGGSQSIWDGLEDIFDFVEIAGTVFEILGSLF